MKNYKALKTAGKVSVAKVTVIDVAKVDEVKDSDGNVTTKAVAEQSHEELRVTQKSYNKTTGEAENDIVTEVNLSSLAKSIQSLKDEIARRESEQADLEQLETDLKAL